MRVLQWMAETIEMLVYALVGFLCGLANGSSRVVDHPVTDDA